MRVLQWSAMPAVVRLQHRTDVVVAIPSGMSQSRVLELASLVLSEREYTELCDVIKPVAGEITSTGRRPWTEA
jgi:hypothetical protein